MTKVLIPLWFIHWKLENRKLPWSLPFQGQLHENKHFHIEGRFYWLTKNQCIITFDVEEELSGVMMAPGPMMRDGRQTSACLGDSDGYISSFRMCWSDESHLRAWMLKDHPQLDWILKHQLNLDEFRVE